MGEIPTVKHNVLHPRAPSDAVLMRRMQAGDTEAFERLHQRFVSRAMVVARGLCLDRNGTADVVQDAFLAVWSGRAGYDDRRGTVNGWVLGIVRHRAIDHARRNARHRIPLRDDHAVAGVPSPHNVENTVIAGGDAAHLRTRVSALPAPQREAITLAYWGELTNTEIATVLSLPLGTVKGRLRLGINRLRSQIAA